MAETAAPAASTTPVKPKKKVSKTRPKTGPGVKELILNIVSNSKDRRGTSYVRVKKALAEGGYDVEHNKVHIKRAVKSLLEMGTLQQTRGSGVSGSFKIGKAADKPKKAVKTADTKPKKPAKKAAKKTVAKKVAKKPTTKTVAAVKKPKAKTTPKKAKKVAAAKKVLVKKATTSPKKKKVAKKVAAPTKAGTQKAAKRVAKPRVKKAAKK